MTMSMVDRAPQVTGTASLFLALSTIFIILRCYCRAFMLKWFGLDDWFAVLAWVLFVLFCAFSISSVQLGAEKQSVVDFSVGLKWWWACELVYVLSNMALKFSIAYFLLRIAVQRIHRVIIWTVIIVTEIYSAVFFVLFVVQCRPLSYFWTQYNGEQGMCINPKVIVGSTYAFSAISCVADWVLGIIPVFLVWNVKTNSRTKLSIAAILAVGAIASTATIIRIPYVRGLSSQPDFFSATIDIVFWSTVETGIGITASAAATLRPLFVSFFSGSLGSGVSESLGRSKYKWPRAVYVRSQGMDSREGFELRNVTSRDHGVSTVIQGNWKTGKSFKSKGNRSDHDDDEFSLTRIKGN